MDNNMNMLGRTCAAFLVVAGQALILLSAPPAGGAEQAATATNAASASSPAQGFKIFNGEKRLFASYGPSTSMGYPARLQRKEGVWEDTAKYKDIALVKDGHHPTQFGDEIIASKFFRAMLEHDRLAIPAWDQEEVAAVRADLKCVPWKP